MKKSILNGGFMLGLLIPIQAHDYADLVHATMWADYLCYDKQHGLAHHWYTDIVQDLTIPYPLRSYSLYLFDTQQFSSLLSYKNQLQENFHHDLSVQKAIALALMREKREQEAEQLFISLAEQFPTAYEVVVPAVQILIRRTDDARAQNMLEKIINARLHRQMTPLCMVLLAQLYIKAHNFDGAYGLMMQCTTYQPSYAPAWLLLGSLEELKHNSEGALEAYRTFSAVSPIQVPDIERRISALQLSSSTSPTGGTRAEQTDLQRIMVLTVQQKYSHAAPLAKQALKNSPHDAVLRALYVHLLVVTGLYQPAIALVLNYIHEQPNDYRWWGALHILALNPTSAACATATLQQARRCYPHAVWGYLYEADCALRQHMFQYAHGMYGQVAAFTTDDVMLSEVCFMQALCGYELDDYALVADAVQRGIASSVVHAPLYNLAAYYYAHEGNYDRAQNLIAHCCALEPYNYHYHDTAAFLTYKKQDFNNAATIFKELHSAHTDDAMILVHAARATHKQKNKERVRELLAHAEKHAYSEYVQRRVQSCLDGERL